MRELEIVFFDAGGTLLRPEPGVGEAYATAGRRYGVEASAEALEAAFREAFHDRKRKSIPQDRAWWRDVVDRTFAGFGEPTDPDALFDDLYEHFARPRAWTLYESAIETVRAVAGLGYRTGLISNWDDRLPGLLDGLGLGDLLEPKIVSAFVGVEKPDPRIYRAALDEAGVEPHRAMLVGDDPEADVAGARAAGMQAVLVDRRGTGNGDGLASLRELVPLLTKAT